MTSHGHWQLNPRDDLLLSGTIRGHSDANETATFFLLKVLLTQVTLQLGQKQHTPSISTRVTQVKTVPFPVPRTLAAAREPSFWVPR